MRMNNPYSFHQQMFEEHNRSFQHMVERFIYRNDNNNNNNNNNNKVNINNRSSSHYNNINTNNNNNISNNNNFTNSKSLSMGGNNNISHRSHHDGVATIESFTPKLLPMIGNYTNKTRSNNHIDSPSAHEMVISIPNEPVYNRSRRQDTLTREGISTARSTRSSDKSSRSSIIPSCRSMRRSELVGNKNGKHSNNDTGKKDSDGGALPLGSTSKINVDDKKMDTVDSSTIVTKSVNATIASAPSHRRAPSTMVSIIDRIYSKKLDKKYDRKLLDQITNDVILQDLGVSFHDIAGNDVPKRILNEAVVLPLLIPEFFTGIRQPWKVFYLHNRVCMYICMYG